MLRMGLVPSFDARYILFLEFVRSFEHLKGVDRGLNEKFVSRN